MSYDPPGSTRPQQKVYDMMMTKPRYAKNHESLVHWVPYDQREYLNKLAAPGGVPSSSRRSAAPNTAHTQLPES